jgi:hypothetical protein
MRVGLAEPPNKAPITEITLEPDEGPFDKYTPESDASCTGRLKVEDATL